MSGTLDIVQALVARRKLRVSDHGVDDIRNDGLRLSDILNGVDAAVIVEDYPAAFKGPTVLALQMIGTKPVHVVWGLAKTSSPASPPA